MGMVSNMKPVKRLVPVTEPPAEEQPRWQSHEQQRSLAPRKEIVCRRRGFIRHGVTS
jgi:hypothetical protein